MRALYFVLVVTRDLLMVMGARPYALVTGSDLARARVRRLRRLPASVAPRG